MSTGKPFKKGFIPMVFSLRLGWSPDGQTLAAVNALDPPNHIVPLLERQTWDGDVNLIGHTGEALSGSWVLHGLVKALNGSSKASLAESGDASLCSCWSPMRRS